MTKIEIASQQISKKYFTIEQAQELVPRVEKIMIRTIKLNKALELLSSIEIEDYNDDYNSSRRNTKLNKEFHTLSLEFYSNIEKLEDMGCLIKDLEAGLIDFYHKLDGRDVLLCWRLGEKEIKFWHEIDTGFLGRNPIFDLNKK